MQLGQKENYDKNTKEVDLNKGDKMLLRRRQPEVGKFDVRWEGPYLVTRKTSKVNYEICNMATGVKQVTHVNRIELIGDYENETSKQLEKSKPIVKKKLGRPRKIVEQPAKEKQDKEVANEKQNSAQGEDERNRTEERDDPVTPKPIPKRQTKKKAKNLDEM